MRILFLLLLISSSLFSNAQIKGMATDDAGNPLNGVTISLLKSRDSSVVKLALTKADGAYEFLLIKPGDYRIKASYVGYKPVFSPVINFNNEAVDLASFRLSKLPSNLTNVTVTAMKPMVEVKADKTILNVEGTINATGSNALELLRKSPGVLLDKDDNISLSGKNGVQVYIDGRSNPLSGQDLANYLKTLQSAQIEAIELITNPSAKYDAAGNAGIINIRLKKNKSLGTNGSVNAGLNMAENTKYNAGFSLNYRNNKINFFSTYGFNYAPNQQYMNINRTIADSMFDQHGSMFDLRKSHNFKAGLDIFLDKKNTLGVMVNGILAAPSSDTKSNTYISHTGTGIVDRLLVADNETEMKRNNANINLNYSYVDPKGTSLTINADRGAYELNSDQVQRNYYFDPSGQVSRGTVIYHMFSPADIKINSLKADYEQNFLKGKLGLGAKLAWVKTDNDFQRYNVNGSVEELDRDRSNHFVYNENINAGYINYNRQLKKLMFQAGLRIERTVSEGLSIGLKPSGSTYVPSLTTFRREYAGFFPSAALNFNKNPKKQWSLSYSRRIDRPAYQDLNPFEFKLDEYMSMKGNVNLRPQYTNSFGLSHIYNFKLNMAVNYSHVKDMFTQLLDTVEKSKAFISKKNLATQDIISFTMSYPFTYKTYTLFTSISSNYSNYQADFGTGRKVDLDAFGFNVFAQNSLKFKKTWTAEITGFFNAPTVFQGSFKSKSLYSVDAGLSKVLLKGKLTAKAAVSDIFYSQRMRASSDFAGQHIAFNFRQESRQFKLNLSYRFGNNGVKPARQRTTGADEETKRVQSGGGLLGN